MAKKRRTSKRPLVPVHPRAAGLDVGATFHVVAVPPDADAEPVRTFKSFTGDLYALADWLKSVGNTTIAMESTSVYWVPVFEILETRGFEVLLVNARNVKNVPGRKTDVNDAQWLQQLHEHGLLRGSFRPRDGIARLRALLRHRERIVENAASHIQHMQKALMLMNVQLHHVIADITGVTGMKIIRSILDGIRDPKVLAAHREPKCKASPEMIRKALNGNYRSEHLFVLRQALELYEFHRAKVAECDVEIEAALIELNRDRESPVSPIPASRHLRARNELKFDVRPALYNLLGADLSQINGFTAYTVLRLVGDSASGVVECRAELVVAIPQQHGRRVAVHGGVAQLLRRPRLGRMARRSDVDHPPRCHVDNEECVDLTEQEIVGLDEVAGPHPFGVIAHEGRPALAAAVLAANAAHVLLDRPLADLDPELEQLAADGCRRAAAAASGRLPPR